MVVLTGSGFNLFGAIGDAEPQHVLAGKRFSSEHGTNLVGAMVNRTGHVDAQSISRSGTALRLRPPKGYFEGDTANSVQISHPTIDPANIKKGVNFANSGLIGTFENKATPQLFDGVKFVPFEIGYQNNVLQPIIDERPTLTIVRTDRTGEGTSGEFAYVSTNLVDLTNVKYVVFDVYRDSGIGALYGVVSTNKNGDHNNVDARVTIEDEQRYHFLDVGSLTGDFYVRVNARIYATRVAASMYIRKILTIGNP